MTLDFGREIHGDASQREWLVTNGIGSYASGTVSGVLSRRYHGLLVAALEPPLGRTVLVSKFDEIANYGGVDYHLFANQWGKSIEPTGHDHLARFHMQGTTPAWTYAVADALLTRTVFMQHEANTTYVRYTLERGTLPLNLRIKAMVNYRDYHDVTRSNGWMMDVGGIENGIRVQATPEVQPFYVLSDRARAVPRRVWYRDYYLQVERFRGLDYLDDNLFAGVFRMTLQPGESVTLVATTDANASRDGEAAYAARREREATLVMQSQTENQPDWIRHLVLAADQFIVRREANGDPDGRSIIAGYHWFSDWGRDTMIALPGLTLTTRRHDEAARILRTYAAFVDQGMLPNRFPDSGQVPEYNTVDATLWYFEAVRAYVAATGDTHLLSELFPVLEEIINWHERGTRYQIHVDPVDGLIYAGEAGVQLTWMDAKIGDWVVTPRTGKPVEINALWYNALHSMADFARALDQSPERYETMAERVRASFARFWAGHYCFDVIDGPDGDDQTLRPNQVFAVSLPHSPLDAAQQKAVVDACGRELLTTMGLRSLSSAHPDYAGTYGGTPYQRDSVYHQGPVWAWLIGHFVAAHLRVYRDHALARSYLEPFAHHLRAYGVGSIAEIAEGDAPHYPRATVAQAWSVAEVLRTWMLIGETT